jgi:hypothetical protein
MRRGGEKSRVKVVVDTVSAKSFGGVGLEEPGVEGVHAPHSTELTGVMTHTGQLRTVWSPKHRATSSSTDTAFSD